MRHQTSTAGRGGSRRGTTAVAATGGAPQGVLLHPTAAPPPVLWCRNWERVARDPSARDTLWVASCDQTTILASRHPWVGPVALSGLRSLAWWSAAADQRGRDVWSWLDEQLRSVAPMEDDAAPDWHWDLCTRTQVREVLSWSTYRVVGVGRCVVM